VPYPYQTEVLVELLRDVNCPFIRQQRCPVLQRHISHARTVFGVKSWFTIGRRGIEAGLTFSIFGHRYLVLP